MPRKQQPDEKKKVPKKLSKKQEYSDSEEFDSDIQEVELPKPKSCKDCKNRTNSLMEVLTVTEKEIYKLRADNELLKSKLKSLETLDLIKVLTENATYKASAGPPHTHTPVQI